MRPGARGDLDRRLTGLPGRRPVSCRVGAPAAGNLTTQGATSRSQLRWRRHGRRGHAPDSTPAITWPLLQQDRKGLREGYLRLSDTSKYQRFLSSVGTLSDDLLRVLVDGVDGVEHVALVLVALPRKGDEEVIGLGRLIRHPDRPTAADVAVTVLDEWQGRGAATVLLDALTQRRPEGVTELITQVASDNPASLAMLRRLGALRITGTASGVHDVEVT